MTILQRNVAHAYDHDDPRTGSFHAVAGRPVVSARQRMAGDERVGGCASRLWLGIASRRYHGLFGSDIPGCGRLVIVPRLDETIEQDGEQGVDAGLERGGGPESPPLTRHA
ncbi:MAG: glycogen debranching enzyme N-terminal domain-containing protein [Nitrospira sp.]|nr:glycogen debranching enzyme N-terminal domain-containing protein [Nitrospira sp.]